MELSAEIRTKIIDEEHLRLLTIGHYIAGGAHIAFASLFIFHFVFMLVAATNPELFPQPTQGRNGPPEAFFQVFVWIIGMFILLGWLFGALTIYSGRCIKERRRRTFSLVMAALNTMAFPLGTLIGVSCLIVLLRPTVKKLYGLWPAGGKS